MPIDLADRISFLKKIHLFYGLDDDSLAPIAAELEEKTYPKDTLVFKQDAPAEGFYMIYSGRVRIVRRRDGKDIPVGVLVKDDYFGELALVSNRRRSATITAVEDTSCLFLSREDFEKLFREHAGLKKNLEVAVRSRQLARKLQFKWLRPDEVIYFLARKHWVAMFPKIVTPIVLLPVPFLLAWAYFNIIHRFIVGLAAGSSLIALVAWLGWLILDWSNDYYIVTDQRVVWLEKVIGVYDSRQESPLSMIVSVGVELTQIGRILDYGHVIVRTFVGRIDFSTVNHPSQAAKMVEEYWQRTRDVAKNTEKEAMKDAIRKQLGISRPPSQAQPASVQPATSVPESRGKSWLRLIGANTLKLRYETGESVIYRKHWVVLLLNSIIPFFGFIGVFVMFLYRLYQLYLLPEEFFISFDSGLTIDLWGWALLFGVIVMGGWFVYRVIDWSNDKFEVTADQIIDIDRKPLGTETRNSAQLENILGTKYERRGILGNLFNFGHVYITVGGNKLVFEDVMDPAAVQSDIDRRRDAHIVKRSQAAVASERERLAGWLATYHQNAEQFKKDEEQDNKRNEKNDSP